MKHRWARLDPRHPRVLKIIAGIPDPEMELAARPGAGPPAFYKRNEPAMPTIKSQDDFIATIAEFKRQCRDKGMQMPFIFVAVSPNGSVIAARLHDSGENETLAQHLEEAGFATPMTVIMVDQTGRAMRLGIDSKTIGTA